jgi:hypothetical protein
MRRPIAPLTLLALAVALPFLMPASPARAGVPRMVIAEEFGATS